MTLDEKIGQMTQIDRSALATPADITDFLLGSILNGGDSLPTPNEPRTWADSYDAFQSRGAQDPARHPDPLRHRRRARPRPGPRRGRVSAQHRPRLHAQPGAGAQGRAGDRGGGRRNRRRLDVRPLHRRARATNAGDAPTKGSAKPPELAAALGTAAVMGLQQAPDCPCWPAPSTSWPTAAPRSARTRATRS